LDDRECIKHELGDVLWYVAALCSELNLSLNEVAEFNIRKLKSRQDRDILKGNGDNR
jgi:NTP pyrophosphatase (non-canonical NTP hydrolase)